MGKCWSVPQAIEDDGLEDLVLGVRVGANWMQFVTTLSDVHGIQSVTLEHRGITWVRGRVGRTAFEAVMEPLWELHQLEEYYLQWGSGRDIAATFDAELPRN